MKVVLSLAMIILLTSCATSKISPVTGDLIAEAPQMKIGDRWKYKGIRGEITEKEVVDVKPDGEFTLRITTETESFQQAKTFLVECDKNHKFKSEMDSQAGKIWNNGGYIDYPLYVGKIYKFWSNRSSIQNFTMQRFFYDFRVSNLTQEKFKSHTINIFTIQFDISHDTSGWKSSGEFLYSPELKSIVEFKPHWRQGSGIFAYDVSPEPLKVVQADGSLQGVSDKDQKLIFGYDNLNLDRKAIALELEKLNEERAQLAQAKQKAQQLAEQNLAEAERLAAAKLEAAAKMEAAAAEAKRLSIAQLDAAKIAADRLAAKDLQKAQFEAERAMAEKLAAEKRAAEELAAKKLREENRNYGIAVIIGNKNYALQNADVPDVAYAHNDAAAISLYVKNTLGFQEGNIIYVEDATQAEFSSIFGNERSYKGKLFGWTQPEKSKIFIYYSGHGAPGLSDGTGYLLPVNADPMTVELNGYPLETLYKNLAKIPARQITVVLDACFSGSSVGGSLVKNASSIALRRVESNQVLRNGAVLTAAAVSEVASWDNERKLGLFTANFLDGVQGAADKDEFGNSDGQVALGEIRNYLSRTVSYKARRNYFRDQHPQVSGDDQLVLNKLQ